ncbi:MAG: hypothetical protein HY905_00790 [Deltaproteobacteria bacterium]|nr:hypothetical protein [Deltaproteobacteria bacterium]
MRPQLSLLLLLVAGCGAKTGLEELDAGVEAVEVEEVVDLPPTARCPDAELWTSPGKLTVIEGGGFDREGDLEYEWLFGLSPAGSTATLSPVHTSYTSFTPDMLGDWVVRLEITDSAGQADTCQCNVHSVPNPPTALCPPDVTDARVGVGVTLEGDGDDVDGTIVGFLWSVRAQPEGSHPTVVPPDAASTLFTADVEGEYEVRFEVIDDYGYRGQCLVNVTATGAPPLDCPEEEYSTPTRRAFAIPAIPVLNGDAVTWSWGLLSWPSDSAGPSPVPPDAASPSLTPDKRGRYVLRATATNLRGLSSECEVVVNATPSGPDAICPAEACTVPLNTITLTGNGVDDGTIVGYHWELSTLPEGSAADPPSPVDGATTSFFPDIAGRFGITLTVQDDDGNRGSCTFEVVAVPSEGLRVEMYWNPPDRSCSTPDYPVGCDATDVDLHLLHPAATSWISGLDCYYANCNASYGAVLEWDAPGAEDNPRLDLDDVEGHGPENINIDDPVVGSEYLVGVHYYDEAGWGPSQVYVRIYCASTSGVCESGPPVDFGPVTLVNGGLGGMEASDFWRVAAVTWNGVTCSVRSLASADGTPNITTHGVVQAGR